MKQNRPVFLDLTKIHFPLPAIASILHRISGFIIFLLIPLLLCMAHSAMTQTGFDQLQQCLTNPMMKFFVWVVMSSLIYHLFAGIRHLFMDMHMGETLAVARAVATFVMILSAIVIILLGVWLW